MRLKLKEKPLEWWKFTAVMALIASLATLLAFRRGLLSRSTLEAMALVLVSILIIAAIRPTWFRGFYRIGMTASFHVGQVTGKVLLTVFFLLVVTPLGLLLRITGKDLLGLKRNLEEASYWRESRPPGPLDRQF
jgi:hypothetical protein